MVAEFFHNVSHNLFKPLLLFFYLGFLIPVLKVPFEFPKPLYQSLTLYLLLAIGWHGGEELASLPADELGRAASLMGVGFFTNLLVAVLAFFLLRKFTKLREIDASVVAGYYGSDSAGTFVTCVGVLHSASIPYAPYMPVLLAAMEIPGCLVLLLLVNRLRALGLDEHGNRPGEPGFDPSTVETPDEARAIFDREALHEVFLNPGLYLLFGGILIGYVSRLQGLEVVRPIDRVFVDIFPAMLCLFLLEMGMTAARRLKDLAAAGKGFIAFGLLAPNLFAVLGMTILHGFSMAIGHPYQLGTYALYAVLCGAASYIAVPAIQRLAVPEASPTLPLAASLGLTFTYNVTLGIPLYLEIAKAIIAALPVAGAATAAAAG